MAPIFKPLMSAAVWCAYWLLTARTSANETVPLPSPRQLAWQSTPLRTFHHFGICTFTGCEHNSGSGTWQSGNASQFNPAMADPEQWVLAAKSFGAGGAVLTARHEGGFCLFPSNFTNYSIAFSPLKGRDLVQEFIDACNKHGIKPSLYFAASCDGYHKNADPLSQADYVSTQLNELQELVTTYKGIEYVWFDHHGNPLGHKVGPHCDFDSSCICDPLVDSFWYDVDALMKKFAPDVLIGGLDLGVGPTNAPPPLNSDHFNTCNLVNKSSTSNSAMRCKSVVGDDVFGDVYRPWEITGSAASKGWFWHGGTGYLNTDDVVGKYYGLVGNGFDQILNFPPNATGLLDDAAVAVMQAAGDRVSSFYQSEISRTSSECTSGTSVTLTLPQGPSVLAGIMLMEDLTTGQRVTGYHVNVSTSEWSKSQHTIGQRRIYEVAPSVSLNTPLNVPVAVQVTCDAVIGSANITVVAYSQPPK